MSTKKAETVNKEAATAVAVKAPESKYSVADFVATAEKFKADKIIVKTALELAGKTEYTETEAIKVINDFKNKEV